MKFETIGLAVSGVFVSEVSAALGFTELAVLVPAVMGSALSLWVRARGRRLHPWDIPWALVAGSAVGLWIGAPVGRFAGLPAGGAFLFGLIGASTAEAVIDNGGADLAEWLIGKLKGGPK